MKKMIFLFLVVFLVPPCIAWGVDDFDHDLLRIYDHVSGSLLVEDTNGETGDQWIAKCNNGLKRRIRLEISFEAEEEINYGEFEIQIWSNSGEAELADGDSNAYSSGFWRDIPSLNAGEIITYTEFIDILPTAEEDDTFYIRLDDQSIRFTDGTRTDDDDRIDFAIHGEVTCQTTNDLLPTASVIQPLPDVIYDDDVQIFIGRSQRTDYRTVWQQTNSGSWELVDPNYPIAQNSYHAYDLVTGNCYSWKSYNINQYGEAESNTVSTCIDSYNEDLAPTLSTDTLSFSDGETKTINISNVPNAFTYLVEKYQDNVLYDTLETDQLSFQETLWSYYSRYSFRARAHYSNGQDSLWGDYLNIGLNTSYLLPTKSTIGSIDNPLYDTSLVLNFSDSENTIGRKVYQKKDDSSFVLIDKIGETSSYTVSNLVPGSEYSWYCVNYNNNGDGPVSNTVSTVIAESAEKPVPTITADRSTYNNGDLVSLSWNNIAETSYFVLEMSHDNVIYDSATVLDPPYHETLFSDYSNYSFRIKAVDVYGNSNGFSRSVYLYNAGGKYGNYPPKITDSVIVDSQDLGDELSMSVEFYDGNDVVNAHWYINGIEVFADTNISLPKRSTEYSFTPTQLGSYRLLLELIDQDGLSTQTSYTFNVSTEPISDKNYFQVRTYSEGDLFYYMGSLYDREGFKYALNAQFGNSERIVELIPGSTSLYTIKVISEEEVGLLQNAGHFILGVAEAGAEQCTEDSVSYCEWLSAAFSSIPVVEEVQEAYSLTFNAIFGLYSGAAYMITGDTEHAEERNRALTTAGFALSGILIPFVADPQGARVYFKAVKSSLPDDYSIMAKNFGVLRKNDDEILEIMLSSDGYSKDIIEATMRRVKNLDSLSPGIKSPKSLEYFASIAKHKGGACADYLASTIKRFEEYHISSGVLSQKHFDTKKIVMSNLDPDDIDYQYKLKHWIKTGEILPGFKKPDNYTRTNASGLLAELRGRSFFNLFGIKKTAYLRGSPLEGKWIYRNRTTGKFMISDKNYYPAGYDNLGDFDALRFSPDNNELWVVQIKNSRKELGSAEKQISRLLDDGAFQDFLIKESVISPDSTVRGIALVDDQFYNIYRLAAIAETIIPEGSLVTAIVLPTEVIDNSKPPSKPGNKGHIPAINLLLGNKNSATILPPGSPGEK